jgi:hypothetical protein
MDNENTVQSVWAHGGHVAQEESVVQLATLNNGDGSN